MGHACFLDGDDGDDPSWRDAQAQTNLQPQLLWRERSRSTRVVLQFAARRKKVAVNAESIGGETPRFSLCVQSFLRVVSLVAHVFFPSLIEFCQFLTSRHVQDARTIVTRWNEF